VLQMNSDPCLAIFFQRENVKRSDYIISKIFLKQISPKNTRMLLEFGIFAGLLFYLILGEVVLLFTKNPDGA
jgi:hypothetical protein